MLRFDSEEDRAKAKSTGERERPVGQKCRHCGERKARVGRNVRRGLCRRCHEQPGVREQYPGRPTRVPDEVRPCLECERPAGTRRRGLCRKCYGIPHVRAMYRSISTGGNRALVAAGEDGERRPPLADGPTSALPGSDEKIRVMRKRLAAGRHLHHPQDARRALA